MKGSLNALKKVGIVLLLIVSTLLMLVPNKVKAVDTINAENNGTYRINVKNGEYIINMKMGDTIHLEFWVGGKRESFVQDWHWTKEGGSGRTQVISVDDNDKFIGKDSVYVTGTQTGHCTFKVHNFLQTRKAKITFNVYEDPIYIVSTFNTNKASFRSDINNDGLVTNMDELILSSYINGEDVGIEDITKLDLSKNVNENNEPVTIINNDDLTVLRSDLVSDDVINKVLKGQTIKLGIKDYYNSETNENITVTSDNTNVISCSGNTLKTVGNGIATITVSRKYNWNTSGSDGAVYQKQEKFKIEVISNELNDSNFIYRIVDGKAVVIKCINTSNGPITIPSQYKGYEIVGIEDNAFTETNITKITIPSTVTSIKPTAFNSAHIKEIEVEDGNPVYFSVNGILYAKIDDNNYALIRCPRDLDETELEISDLRVKNIGAYAFYGCDGLESILLPSSITTIMENAFNGCTGIEVLALPNNISTLISTDGNVITTDIFTGITKVVYNKTEGDDADKVYTDTYSKMSEYIKTCKENGDTTFIANGDDIEVIQTSHDYGKVQIGEDGILNVNLKLGETSRYEVTINVGDKFKIVPNKARDYKFEFDNDDGIDYSPYARITKNSTGTIIKSFEYFVEGIKKTEKGIGAKIVLSYKPLGNASFYKAVIKVNVEEPPIYIVGNEQDTLKIKGDLNGDNLLSEIDLRYFDLYRDGDASINWINFDFDNDNTPTSNDVTLFNKESNKVFIDDEIELFAKRDKGEDKEKDNIEFKSETPNIAVVKGNKVKFIAEGKAIITANRIGQARKDRIEFTVTSRVKESDGCKYIINEDGTITIIEYNIPVINGEVGLPAMIDEIEVTGIGANIFANNEDKDKIKVVTIPKYVTEISEDAFNDLINLEEFKVEEGNEKFIAYEKVLYKYNDAGDELILVRCPNTFTELKIPAKINGVSVTEIANKAFYKNENIVSIETTSNILKIGNSAFEGCKKLSQKIGIPTKLKYLGDKAFAGCTGLENVELEIPTTLVEIGNEVFNGAKIKAVYYFKYEGYEIMHDYINETEYRDEDGNLIGKRVRGDNDIPTESYIMKDAQFEDENTGILYQIIKDSEPMQVQVVGLSDKAQGEVEIPASIFIKDGQIVEEGTEGAIEFLVTKMIELSLSTNADVTAFTVGPNVNEIATNTFRNLTNLEKIDIALGNTNYISDGGVLYRIKDKDENGNPKSLILVKYPNKKEGTAFTINKVKGIPVVGIEEYAFEGSKDLTKLNINENVKTIGAYAFYNCEKIQNLIIPEKAVLGENVFNGIRGPVIEYMSDYWWKNGPDAVFSYFSENDVPVQYAVVYLDPYYDGCIDVIMGKPTASEESIIKKIKLVSASGKVQEEIIEDYKEEITGTGTVPSSGEKFYTSRIRIKEPGGYEVRLIDKDGNEITVANIEITAENFRYLINYHPNVEQENVVKMPETGTKAINESTTISQESPQARGKLFIEWNTKADGTGTKFNKGDVYSENADLDLYAIWESEANAVDHIEITQEPKTKYIEGQLFDKTGMKVVATYGNGTTKEVTNYTIENSNIALTTNITEITISYTENYITKKVTLPISVIAKKIERIDVTTNPRKTIYVEQEKFDITGMVVTATYNDGKTIPVTGYKVTNGDSLEVGQTSVNIVYVEGETTTNTIYNGIIVNARKLESIEITSNPTKLTYVEGEKFDKTGIVIKAKYNNNVTEEIDGYEVVENGELTTNNKTVTIIYKENDTIKSATIEIKVIPKELTSIEITKMPEQKEYVEGQNFNTNGLELLIRFNDESQFPVTYGAGSGESGLLDETTKLEFENNKDLKLGQESVTLKATYTNPNNGNVQTISIPCPITVIAKALDKIEIAGEPKTTYIEGQSFDKEGLIINAIYNDESKVPVTNYEIKPEGKLSLDTTKVIIVYTEGDVTSIKELPIKVVEKGLTSIEITKEATKTTYIEGLDFDKSGMEIKVHYSNGDTKIITDITKFEIQDGKNLEVGKQNVTVSYTENGIEAKATQNITVNAKTLTGITVDPKNVKKEYIEGQNFDTNGIVVTAIYNNGKEIPVSGYKVEDGNNLSIGKTSVIISYTENDVRKTDIVDIRVTEKQISGIEVKTPATKTKYIEGENFDTTGMIVNVLYNNGTSDSITDYVVTDGNNLSSGKTSVTISYRDRYTTTQPITVVKPELTEITISAQPTKTKYIEGEDFDKTGMVVTAKYSDGQEVNVTDQVSIIGGNSLTTARVSVTISYTDNGITKTIQQAIEVEKALPANPIKEDSELKIEDDKYIENIQPNTDIEKLKENIVEGYTLKIFKADGKTEVTNELIGTGMIAAIYRGDTKVLEYEIVVMGDANGDGQSTIKDMIKINKHRLNKASLEGVYFKAADVNGDGTLNIKDMVKVNKFRLGKISKY